MFFDISGFM